jgi:hypothetical protein
LEAATAPVEAELYTVPGALPATVTETFTSLPEPVMTCVAVVVVAVAEVVEP